MSSRESHYRGLGRLRTYTLRIQITRNVSLRSDYCFFFFGGGGLLFWLGITFLGTVSGDFLGITISTISLLMGWHHTGPPTYHLDDNIDANNSPFLSSCEG